MKQKLKGTLLSITLLFTNYIAAQIPFEGTHLTLTSYNQITIDNRLLSKNLTMDVIMDRLSPITNNNKAPKMPENINVKSKIQEVRLCRMR